MNDAASLAQAANGALSQYVAVHDDIFGGSLWRGIRRSVPIPGLFQAIPYAAHVETLGALRQELRTILGRSSSLLAEAPQESTRTVFIRELEQYCHALEDTVSCLYEICAEFADKAKGSPGPSWTDYRRKLDEYERSRQSYAALGPRLNQAFSLMQPEDLTGR